MRIRFCAVPILFLSLSSIASAEAFFSGPDGIEADCAGLHRIAQMKGRMASQMGGGAFKVKYLEWTPEIGDFLKQAAESCATLQVNQQERLRQSPAMFERNVGAAYGLRDRTKQAIDEILAQVEGRKAKQEAQQRMAACTSTPQATLFAAQESVIDTLANLDGAQKSLAHERHVTDVSGVKNLSSERMLGEIIVTNTDILDRNFAAYKRLGGKAATPRAVTHTMQNPCPPGGQIAAQ